MNDKAGWETPELDRLGDSGTIQSGQSTNDTEGFSEFSVPSGPIGPQ
jgi:hypothetical protein